jgi:hypothetical protein
VVSRATRRSSAAALVAIGYNSDPTDGGRELRYGCLARPKLRQAPAHKFATPRLADFVELRNPSIELNRIVNKGSETRFYNRLAREPEDRKQ